MKKILIVLLAVAILATAGIALAGISGSPHDVGTYLSKGGEPCAYCHTPHQGATSKYPLWNRSQDPTTYSLYSSNTFNMSTGGASTTNLDEGSAPCMVCHNGASSTLVNYPGRGSADQAGYNLIGTDFLQPTWSNLGNDLQNEHPISFTYDPGAANTAGDTNNFPGIVLSGVNSVGGTNMCFPLFKGQGNSNQFSCATCHTVHHTPKDTYTISAGPPVYEVYFLRTTNVGSKMCNECHVSKW